MGTKTTTKKETSKKEFNLNSLVTMWLKKSKNGSQYLSGVDMSGKRIVGFINGKKKNPKEPDIRLYYVDEEGKAEQEEFTSLWVNVSKNDKKYITGKIGDERIVGFFVGRAKVDGKIPYFNLYRSDDMNQKEEEKSNDGFVPVPEEAEELPFQ